MESTIKLKVKWGKHSYSLELNSNKTFSDLKNELHKLTQVLPIEQKLIFKGKVLLDSGSLSTLPLNPTLSLLGAAPVSSNKDINPSSVRFVEDLTEEQKLQILREKGEDIAFGLKNLGNTCYLNSTVQCLGRVSEFRKALEELANKPAADNSIGYLFTQALGSTYTMLDKATDAVIPLSLVNSIRKLNPMFDEAENGVHKQQDADECVSLILNTTKQYLKSTNEDGFSKNLIEELFGIEMQIKLKCIENEKEIKIKK